MGMTIEDARTALGKERKYALHENKQAFDIAIDTMHKYQQMQADYEQRLKADMVAMLTDIQITLEEMLANETLSDNRHEISDVGVGIELCLPVIQQKINALQGEDR